MTDNERPEHVMLEVLRGSQAHGLADDGADTDSGFVFARPARQWFLFEGRPQGDAWSLRKGVDETGWEIHGWIKAVMHGQPNHTEFLFAPVISIDEFGEELRANRDRLFDSGELVRSAVNYARDRFQSMIAGPHITSQRQQAKYASAILRVLFQTRTLLETGDYPVASIADSPIGPTLRRFRESGEWTVGEVADLMIEGIERLRPQHIALPTWTADTEYAQDFVNRVRRAYW